MDSKDSGVTAEATGTVRDTPKKENHMPLNASEASIEAELRTKGLNAPRLAPEDIDAEIIGEAYYVFPGTAYTVCLLTLKNGFHVTGASAAASPENFDEGIGRRIARENARNNIWALEGYRLREELSGMVRKSRVHYAPLAEPDDPDDIQAKLGQRAQ